MWRFWTMLVVPSICQGQVVDSWIDFGRGNKPAFTIGVILPEIKVWDFTEPGHPCREIGQLWQIKTNHGTDLLVGGYLSNWAKSDDWFLEPYLVFDHKISDKWDFNGQLGIYAPLTGGSWAVFSSESRLTAKVGDRTEVGLAGSFWRQEGGSCSKHWGLIIRQRIEKVTIAARWLPFGGQDTARLEVVAPIKF